MAWSGGVYTRTNGTYTGSTVWAQDAAAAVKIQSTRHDTHDQDLAAGINACVAKDGTNTLTILNLSGTVNSTSGYIKVGAVSVFNTYGSFNVFAGALAGNFTLTGSSNCGVGYSALIALTSGAANAAYGYGGLASVTTGSFNTGMGYGSLPVVTTASNNTAVGALAGSNATGATNTLVGAKSGINLTTGSNNVCLGYNIDLQSNTADNQLSIQNALYGVNNAGTLSTLSTGNLGVYVKAPTARLHLIAGTAAAGTAPLKLTAGTNLTTPENGAIEFDGSAVYITIGGVRKTFTLT